MKRRPPWVSEEYYGKKVLSPWLQATTRSAAAIELRGYGVAKHGTIRVVNPNTAVGPAKRRSSNRTVGSIRFPEFRQHLRGGAVLGIFILTFLGCHHVKPNKISDGAQHVFALAKDIEAELIKDGNANRNFQELLPAYHQKLKPLLEGDWERGCNGNCMNALFRATDYVCFFSHGQVSDPELPDVMRTSFNRLKSSGRASKRQANKVRKCLIKFRRFDEAREFSVAEQLDGEEIPSLEVPTSMPAVRRVIEYAPDGRTLSVVQAKPLGETAVLMLAGSTCAASQEAMKEIESDAAFRKALAGRLTIISPPSGVIEAAAFADWNRRHPRYHQTQAFGAQDWPEVTDWGSTPTFYFIRKGKVIADRFGWGPGALDGIKKELRNLDASMAE